MTSIQIKNEEIREQLDAWLQDPYLKKCLGEVDIPVCFVEMLEQLFMIQTAPQKTSSELLATAAILLQMALEMHTHVSTKQKLSAEEMLERQRYVLAGDYYSSLFYHMLANHQKIAEIRQFSETVRTINQAKLSFHLKWIQQRQYDQEMIEYLKIIQSGLLLVVADFFHVQEDLLDQWKKLSSLYLLVDYLERSEEWKNISKEILLQIQEEWREMLHQVHKMKQENYKQQWLDILSQKNYFVEQLVPKES